jgi:imidazolonepropionase-like amidohydrolase
VIPAALLLLAACLGAEDLALTGGTVYPGPETAPVPGATVLIHDGRIAAVGARETVRVPAGAKVIDISGKYVVAGFWNSHVHIFTPVLLNSRKTESPALQAELDAMFNRWGFTTVFDIASVLDNTLALRGRIDGGELRGPHIRTTGEPLWTETPVYVRDFLRSMGIQMPPVSTPADAAARVRALARAGSDGIKLFTGSMQGRGKVANMPVALVRAAAGEAHAARLPVFAHPQNSAGLDAAIDGGVDILAHTAPDSPPWTPAFVARLVGAKMALIPTLTLFDFEARKGGDSDQDREAWLAKMVGELRAFSSGGGQVLFGTDIGYTDHYDTALEFTLMARAGMTFSQILASLTTNPSERFGYAGRSGRVAEGRDADLVVLGSDPAKDVTALSQVQYTIRGGNIIYLSN